MSQENQNDQYKRDITMESFNQFFSALVTYVAKLDMHSLLKQHCFQNLDQGADWARRGISIMTFPEPNPESSEVKDTLVQE